VKDAPKWAMESQPRLVEAERTRNREKGKQAMNPPTNIPVNTGEASNIVPNIDDLITMSDRPIGSKTTKTTLQA